MRLKIRDFRDETCLSTEIFLFLRCNAPSIEAKPNYNSKNAFVLAIAAYFTCPPEKKR